MAEPVKSQQAWPVEYALVQVGATGAPQETTCSPTPLLSFDGQPRPSSQACAARMAGVPKSELEEVFDE